MTKNLTIKDLDSVYNLVQNTIRTCYSKYYASGVVDFFSNHHSKENITADILAGNVYGFYEDNRLIATGTIVENGITRVFVNPDFQGQGIGTSIFDMFEKIIFEKYDSFQLDASLAAVKMYENRGYKTLSHEITDCKNGAFLVYEIMGKKRYMMIKKSL